MATAEQMFHRLRGLFCIYKPPGKSMQEIVRSMQMKLVQELNGMPCRPPRQIIKISEDNRSGSSSSLPTITTVPDLADHSLVVGPRYVKEDFELFFGDALPTHGSGVTLMALGTPSWLKKVILARHMRVYEIKGELGKASHNFTSGGRTIEKTTYGHVTPAKIDRVITAMQAGHQKNMLISTGIDLQSQEAYELAVSGLSRPKTREAGPVIYGFKCTHFEPPHFTLEVHAVNEKADYLERMVHDLGLEMRTSAVCTQLRRVRYGRLLLDHALLPKHWTAEHLTNNIRTCRELLTDDALTHQPLIRAEQDQKEQLPAGS